MPVRTPFPTDVSDEAWAFVAPYLALLPEDAGQRRHALREVLNAVRWLVRAGASWRLLPHDFSRRGRRSTSRLERWLAAGVFAVMVHDPRALGRVLEDRAPAPTAVVLDSRTLQATPERGPRVGPARATMGMSGSGGASSTRWPIPSGASSP